MPPETDARLVALLDFMALDAYERARRTAQTSRELRGVLHDPAANLFDRGTAGLWLFQVSGGVRNYG